MLTMKEIRRNNYHVPLERELTDAQKSKYQSSMKYIDSLAAATKTNISDWPITDLFVREDAVQTERAKINKIFFEFRETLAPEETEKTIAAKALNQKFSAVLSKSYAGTIRSKKSSITSYSNQIKSGYDMIRIYQKELSKLTAELAALEAPGNQMIDLDGMVQEAMAKCDLYTKVDIEDNLLYFYTKPITIFYKNEKRGVDETVRMGEFAVEVHISEHGFWFKVFPQKDNIKFSSYWHPHVASGGELCYGNMSSEISIAASTFNLVKCMEIVSDVLTIYHDNNPYANITSFKSVEMNKIQSDPVKSQSRQLGSMSVDDLRTFVDSVIDGYSNQSGARTPPWVRANDGGPVPIHVNFDDAMNPQIITNSTSGAGGVMPAAGLGVNLNDLEDLV